jgi:hypothetical protein
MRRGTEVVTHVFHKQASGPRSHRGLVFFAQPSDIELSSACTFRSSFRPPVSGLTIRSGFTALGNAQ